jgi:uncharacterized protein (DUF305 family)
MTRSYLPFCFSQACIKQMAQKIIDDQEKEIAEIQAWLKQNGK